MTTIEHIKRLANGLSAEQRKELALYLEKGTASQQKPGKARSLKGSWKIDLPPDFDLDKALAEIRNEWKSEMDDL